MQTGTMSGLESMFPVVFAYRMLAMEMQGFRATHIRIAALD